MLLNTEKMAEKLKMIIRLCSLICMISLQCSGYNDTGVIFIKTHKTASSTVSAMFRTNAVMKWNTSIFIPPIGYGGFQWDLNNPEHKFIISSQTNKFGSPPYRFWTSHVKYHHYFNTLITQPKVFVTILRSPITRLKSAWKYYTNLGVLRKNTTIAYIIQNANERTEWNPNGMTMELSGIMDLNNETVVQVNHMSDSYFKTNSLEEAHALITEAIRSRFLTCLITERLHESLTLFWLKMGWNELDMIYKNIKPSTTNEKNADTKDDLNFQFSESDIALVKEASRFDMALYLEALSVLNEEISEMDNPNWLKPLITTCDDYSENDLLSSCGKLDMFQHEADATVDEVSHNGEQEQMFEKCRCVLLGLDDTQWSEWMHSISPKPTDSNHDNLNQLNPTIPLSPLATCYINKVETACSIAPESVTSPTSLDLSLGWRIVDNEKLGFFGSIVTNQDGEEFNGCDIDSVVGITIDTLKSEEGSLLMVKRGGCSFLRKATTAQSLGFNGLIIVDTPFESLNDMKSSESYELIQPPTPSLGGSEDVVIPVFMINNDRGEEIWTLLASKGDPTDISFQVSLL